MYNIHTAGSASSPIQVTLQVNEKVDTGAGSSLLSRNWLSKIRLNWHEIRAVSQSESLAPLLHEYSEDGLGTIDGFEAKLYVAEGAWPRFHKPRPVPFALCKAAEEELDRLERVSKMENVENSNWAAPLLSMCRKNSY